MVVVVEVVARASGASVCHVPSKPHCARMTTAAAPQADPPASMAEDQGAVACAETAYGDICILCRHTTSIRAGSVRTAGSQARLR